MTTKLVPMTTKSTRHNTGAISGEPEEGATTCKSCCCCHHKRLSVRAFRSSHGSTKHCNVGTKHVQEGIIREHSLHSDHKPLVSKHSGH